MLKLCNMNRFQIVFLALAACGSSELTDTEYRDVAAIVGSSVATPGRGGSVGASADSLTIARGEVPKGFTLDSSGVVSGNRDGMTYRYKVICLSTWPSSSLAACDPPASAAIVDATWEGTLEMAAFTGPISRHAVFRLSNLASPMGIVTGTTTLDSQRAKFEHPERFYDVTDTQDLMMLADMATHEMMGGELSAAITVELDRPYLIDARVTINSDHSATLVLDDDHSYEIDLDTGNLR